MSENEQNICSVKKLGVDFEEIFRTQLSANEDNIYWIIYSTVQRIVRQYREEKDDQEVAINIEKFAEFLNIKIAERMIAGRNKLFKDEVAGFIDHFDYPMGNNQCMIYVNENLGELSKRYVIAHEISHYILNNGEQKNKVEYCRMVMLSKNNKERICDIMASFIIMPIESVMKLMFDFCNDKRQKGHIPIDADEWLHFLGYSFKLSNYHTVLCYQDIRNLAGVLWLMGFMDEDDKEHRFEDEEINHNLKEYQNLFR